MNKLKARIDAFNRFVVDAKATGVWDSIEAACIMAGWSNVAGALTPLKGAAPTNNGFIDSDLDAGIGLAGDGSSYVDSNRGNDADGQNDAHLAMYASSPSTTGNGGGDAYAGVGGNDAGAKNVVRRTVSPLNVAFRVNNDDQQYAGSSDSVGFIATSRSQSSQYIARIDGASTTLTDASQTPQASDLYLYRLNWTTSLACNPTLAFYSIGSSVDLAALDAVVSQLAADLRAIDEDGFDPLATDYIRRVEAADGAYLETGVKQAINAFVVGCRKDGTLDALKASCILCGARTISGALVPLVGTAPTPYNFTGDDYSRTTGIKGDGSTTYLDSNAVATSGGVADYHQAAYVTQKITTGSGFVGSDDVSQQRYLLYGSVAANETRAISGKLGTAYFGGAGSLDAGFKGVSRSASDSFSGRSAGVTQVVASDAGNATALTSYVFAVNQSGTASNPSDARLAFYSIGSAIHDLALLDNRVTTLISSIATALS